MINQKIGVNRDIRSSVIVCERLGSIPDLYGFSRVRGSRRTGWRVPIRGF